MRYTLLDSVEQGEKLGRPIYTADGRVLLEDGVVLTIGLISRLRRMGVHALYLQDEMLKDIDPEEVVSEATKREAVEAISQSMQFVQSGKKDFDMKGVSKSTNKIIEEILLNQNILVSLSDIRTSDNNLFVHATNVAVMSIIVGIKLGLKRSELRDLAIGALFHDIGKVVPDDPNAKRGENDHTWKGFNVLRKNHEISMSAAHVALQHHEYMDGSGTPRQVTGDKIPMHAKIVAVTNYYDNLVHPIDGSQGMHPYEAGETILGLTNIRFDHAVVWEFLRSIAFYPTGRQVMLSTGETGAVVGQNNGLPQRPVIRVFNHSQKSKFEDFDVKEIDLGKETTVFIQKML
ncbi:HD domain-containing phosphohydrolase [Bacillus tianshenii]|nr:HD domain-containing phosphohydrolase [Bacillus tianshenii]